MDFTLSSLMAGIVLGLVGWVIFGQGKRESNISLIGIGIALMVAPYFVSNLYVLWGAGAVLTYVSYQRWDS